MTRQSILATLNSCFRNGIHLCKQCRNIAFNKDNLYFVNVIMSMVMSGMGDAMCQAATKVMQCKQNYDRRRTAKMVISDGYLSGTATHFIYKKIDSVWPEQTFVTTMKKVALDQVVVAPICISIFYFAVGYMSAQSIAEIIAEIEKSGARMYVTQFCIWLPVQLFNFYFVPSQYRMFYISCFSLLEASFISRIRFDSVTCYNN